MYRNPFRNLFIYLFHLFESLFFFLLLSEVTKKVFTSIPLNINNNVIFRNRFEISQANPIACGQQFSDLLLIHNSY